MHTENIDAECETILRNCGWTPTRWVDPQPVICACKLRGLPTPSSYVAIVANVYGISVDLFSETDQTHPIDSIRFDPLICFTDSLHDCMRKLGKVCLPLAEVDHINFLYMAIDNTFWLDGRELRKVGQSFGDVMRHLLQADQPA